MHKHSLTIHTSASIYTIDVECIVAGANPTVLHISYSRWIRTIKLYSKMNGPNKWHVIFAFFGNLMARARAHIRASCGYYIRTERQRWSEKFATPLISTERASIRNNWPKTTKKKRSSSSCHVKTTYRRLKPIDRHVFHSSEYPWCVLFECVSLVDWIDVFFLVPHSLSLTFVPRCRDSFRDAFQTNKLLLLLLFLSSVEWDFPNSFFLVWFCYFNTLALGGFFN